MKYMNFTQTISFRTEHEDEIIKLSREWDEMQAEADVMSACSSKCSNVRFGPSGSSRTWPRWSLPSREIITYV